ncbi:hypothetical protein [uncultured Lacinutrix sp.]|uniref:hypothetical protein n=1 Tax=uncultured Lacinutrix sp. TaxID=574032 RepID=UPI00261276C0|nr:hypothetical protein [uncultured Lacinutrix sp.]
MNKSLKIILSILLISVLTSVVLYKKHLKKQVRIEQQEKANEVARENFKQQRELKIKLQEEEHLRILDSANVAKQQQLNDGLKKLREAKIEIEKELKESN